jgi:zinc and cadmium transporter
MNEYAWLGLYCTLVLLFSLCGAGLPFLGRVTHGRLQLYLSAAAGVMLGAAFFHVMPDALKLSGEKNFGWFISIGVVGLFCIERFIAPHSHELGGRVRDEPGDGHHGENHLGHEHGECGGHDHAHAWPAEGKDHRAAAPAIAGWAAVLGLTIHTFMNGVALAAAVYTACHLDDGTVDAKLVFPGLAIFLAIVLHKPADALAISMVLSRKGVSRPLLAAVQFGFGATVAVGVVAFYLTEQTLDKSLQNELAGFALAFSAGTFLFIALSDLLPEVQFHRHDRVPLFLALILGVALMGGIAYLEPEEHDEHKEKDKAVAVLKLEDGK